MQRAELFHQSYEIKHKNLCETWCPGAFVAKKIMPPRHKDTKEHQDYQADTISGNN